MSKVKAEHVEFIGKKEKARGSLRRQETKAKKRYRFKAAKTRQNDAKGSVYKSNAGYRIIDSKQIAESKIITIPEQIIENGHWKINPITLKKTWVSEHTYTIVPEHTQKVKVYSEKAIEPYLKRISVKKKAYKQIVNKKARRYNKSLGYKGNTYKEVDPIKYHID